MVILAGLFLTACQLTTADTSSRGKQKHRALRSTDKKRWSVGICRLPGGLCAGDASCCEQSCNIVHRCD
nr:TPA_inf: conotoxin precursor O1 [Conus judaeus]